MRIKTINIFLVLLLLPYALFAGEEKWSNTLSGSEIDSGMGLSVEDQYTEEIILGATDELFLTKSSTVFLELAFDQTHFNYFGDSWGIIMNYEIELTDENGEVTSVSILKSTATGFTEQNLFSPSISKTVIFGAV